MLCEIKYIEYNKKDQYGNAIEMSINHIFTVCLINTSVKIKLKMITFEKLKFL